MYSAIPIWTVALIGKAFLDHFLLSFSFLEGQLNVASEVRFQGLSSDFPTGQFTLHRLLNFVFQLANV